MITKIEQSPDMREKTAGNNGNGEQIPRNIFEKLPTPVIGVNSDQSIILVNGKAQTLAVDSLPIETGKKLFEYFPDHITGRVSLSLHTNTVRTVEKCFFEGMLYNLDCIPFSDSGKVKGGLMVFRPI